MKKCIVISVLLICSLLVLVSCTKSKPDEAQLAADLTNALNLCKDLKDTSLKDFLALADLKKQNGMSQSQNDYTLMFTGHLKVIKPFYSIQGTKPLLHTTIWPWHPRQAVRLEVGDLIEFKGKASYVLTEKGWKISGIDAPVITPNNRLEVFGISK